MVQFLGFGSGKLGDKTVTGTETVNIYTGCSGSAGSKTLTVDDVGGFSAGDLVLIHKSRGETTTTCGTWELNKIDSIGTGFTLLLPLVNTYQDSGNDQSQCVLVPEYRGLTVQGGGTLNGNAWNGNSGGILALACSAQININASGIISANSLGFRGGSGPSGWPKRGSVGEGTVGPEIAENPGPNGNGGGGGDWDINNQASSGGGGNGVAATTGNNSYPNSRTPGVGGLATGSTDLTTAVLGGGGGSGSRSTEPSWAGDGGVGGGVVFIFSRSLIVAGNIYNNGGDGQAGASIGGGAGGAGGSIYIASVTANIGTNLITALGGTGVGNYLSTDGAVGRIRLNVCSLTGSATNPASSNSLGGHNFCGSVVAII